MIRATYNGNEINIFTCHSTLFNYCDDVFSKTQQKKIHVGVLVHGDTYEVMSMFLEIKSSYFQYNTSQYDICIHCCIIKNKLTNLLFKSKVVMMVDV